MGGLRGWGGSGRFVGAGVRPFGIKGCTGERRMYKTILVHVYQAFYINIAHGMLTWEQTSLKGPGKPCRHLLRITWKESIMNFDIYCLAAPAVSTLLVLKSGQSASC